MKSKLNRALQQKLLYKNTNHAQHIKELETQLTKTEKSCDKKLDLLQTSLNKKLADEKLIGETLNEEIERHKETITKRYKHVLEN